MKDDEGFSKHERVFGDEADRQRAAEMCLKRHLHNGRNNRLKKRRWPVETYPKQETEAGKNPV